LYLLDIILYLISLQSAIKDLKYLLVYNLERLYTNFFIRLSLFSKHSRDNLNIDSNIKFVIKIKIYFVKIDNKANIDILKKTILYCFIN